jgi:hypothetical protein
MTGSIQPERRPPTRPEGDTGNPSARRNNDRRGGVSTAAFLFLGSLFFRSFGFFRGLSFLFGFRCGEQSLVYLELVREFNKAVELFLV